MLYANFLPSLCEHLASPPVVSVLLIFFVFCVVFPVSSDCQFFIAPSIFSNVFLSPFFIGKTTFLGSINHQAYICRILQRLLCLTSFSTIFNNDILMLYVMASEFPRSVKSRNTLHNFMLPTGYNTMYNIMQF